MNHAKTISMLFGIMISTLSPNATLRNPKAGRKRSTRGKRTALQSAAAKPASRSLLGLTL